MRRPRRCPPDGDRLVPIHNENTRGATGWCLEIHNLAVSKLVAGRDKDFEFVALLLRHQLAESSLVRGRLERTELSGEVRALAQERLSRLVSDRG